MGANKQERIRNPKLGSTPPVATKGLTNFKLQASSFNIILSTEHCGL